MDCFVWDNAEPEGVAFEDGILQRGLPAGAGSDILNGFVSPIDAYTVTRLAGLPVAGRTRMDEFGLSGLDDGAPDAPSGAVEAVAGGLAACALANDVSGKLRRQAPGRGLCYLHPTYGTVSRYGLIPSASSMDQIGVVCRGAREGFGLLSRIAGKDDGDGAMFPDASYVYAPESRRPKIGVVTGFGARADAMAPVEAFARKFDAAEVELPFAGLLAPVWTILFCAELSGNISRYDGVKFGYRTKHCRTLNELYLNTRAEGFGRDVKLAAVLGCLALSQSGYHPLYEKAMKLRRLIRDSLPFDRFDVLALPAALPGGAYRQLALGAPATLAGLPSLSFPYAGGGIQLLAPPRRENALFAAWEEAVS